jgi:hypothetical protein
VANVNPLPRGDSDGPSFAPAVAATAAVAAIAPVIFKKLRLVSFCMSVLFPSDCCFVESAT